MRANVYTDKSLERYAGRFVWLSINTEAPETAAFLKKYPIPALPTLLVLDPKRNDVALRYVGGANIKQMRDMLDGAEQRYRSRSEAAADKLLAAGDGVESDGQHLAAAKSYEAALKNAPGRWRRYGRAAESLIFSLSLANQDEQCATRALALYPKVKGTVSAVNVAATGLSCAAGMDKDNKNRLTFLAPLEKATREVFAD